jgi:uncharacterized protein
MTLKQQIDSDLKAALLNGKKDEAMTLRGLKSVILNAEIAQGKRDEGLDDQAIMQLLAKEVKSRQESIDLYVQGGNQERADQERAEKVQIEAYLPKQLDDNALALLVDQAISETGEFSTQTMGKVIARVRELAAGQADGARIASAVKGRLE